MSDLNTVIQALEQGFENDVCADRTFRFGDMPQPYNVTHLMGDALAHLKTLVPRVLDLDELHRGMAVWLEDIDKDEVILAIGGASCGGAKCFITVYDKSIAVSDGEYNVRWRAWTHEPSMEQRMEATWHDH